MSHSNLNATEILEAWHENMQKLISDPRLAEFMQQSYQQLSGSLASIYENAYATSNSSTEQLDALATQHRAFEDRLAQLEARISIIERAIAGNLSK